MPSQAHLFLPLPNTEGALCPIPPLLRPHLLLSIRLDPTHAKQRIPSTSDDQHPVLLREHHTTHGAGERTTGQLRPIKNAEGVQMKGLAVGGVRPQRFLAKIG